MSFTIRAASGAAVAATSAATAAATLAGVSKSRPAMTSRSLWKLDKQCARTRIRPYQKASLHVCASSTVDNASSGFVQRDPVVLRVIQENVQAINAVKLQEISPFLVEAADADKVDILAQGCLKVQLDAVSNAGAPCWEPDYMYDYLESQGLCSDAAWKAALGIASLIGSRGAEIADQQRSVSVTADDVNLGLMTLLVSNLGSVNVKGGEQIKHDVTVVDENFRSGQEAH